MGGVVLFVTVFVFVAVFFSRKTLPLKDGAIVIVFVFSGAIAAVTCMCLE